MFDACGLVPNFGSELEAQGLGTFDSNCSVCLRRLEVFFVLKFCIVSVHSNAECLECTKSWYVGGDVISAGLSVTALTCDCLSLAVD